LDAETGEHAGEQNWQIARKKYQFFKHLRKVSKTAFFKNI
jgi:hypothetical protein